MRGGEEAGQKEKIGDDGGRMRGDEGGEEAGQEEKIGEDGRKRRGDGEERE